MADPATGACAVIDSVMDFDPDSARTAHRLTPTGSRRTSAAAASTLAWILETHVHADHLSAAPYLRERLGGRIGIGARIADGAAHLR